MANSADPDEMPPYAAFHQDLHCLPKVPVYVCPVYKGLNKFEPSIPEQRRSDIMGF